MIWTTTNQLQANFHRKYRFFYALVFFIFEIFEKISFNAFDNYSVGNRTLGAPGYAETSVNSCENLTIFRTLATRPWPSDEERRALSAAVTIQCSSAPRVFDTRTFASSDFFLSLAFPPSPLYQNIRFFISFSELSFQFLSFSHLSIKKKTKNSIFRRESRSHRIAGFHGRGSRAFRSKHWYDWLMQFYAIFLLPIPKLVNDSVLHFFMEFESRNKISSILQFFTVDHDFSLIILSRQRKTKNPGAAAKRSEFQHHVFAEQQGCKPDMTRILCNAESASNKSPYTKAASPSMDYDARALARFLFTSSSRAILPVLQKQTIFYNSFQKD